jgi:hypothetical protein
MFDIDKMTPWQEFCFFFCVEALSYFLIVANTRAFTQGLYFWTASTDFVFAGSNFFLIRKVAKTDTKAAWAGYTFGGTCGSLISMWITIHIYGK